MENTAFAEKALERIAAEASDEELVARAKTGDSEAFRSIWTRYRQFVRMKANSYFLVGVTVTISSRKATRLLQSHTRLRERA